MGGTGTLPVFQEILPHSVCGIPTPNRHIMPMSVQAAAYDYKSFMVPAAQVKALVQARAGAKLQSPTACP